MPRCSACGTDNKAVAKFCRQCGAPMGQSAPDEDDDRTVIIPSTAAPPRTSPAASASGSAVPDEVVPPARHREADAAKATRPLQPEKSAKGTGPLIALAAAAFAVLAGGGYFVWNAMSEKPAAAPVEQDPAPQPEPPAAALAPQSAPAAAEPAPAAPAVPPQAESTAPPAAAEAPPATPEPETTPEPVATPAAGSVDKKAKDKAAAKAARAERRKREAAEKARRAASAPAPAVQEAAPPAPPAPKPDPETARWATMKRELSECGSLNVFCREGVRWKYCSGYWGKVPACPGSGKN